MPKLSKAQQLLAIVSLYSIAMGLLECAVVIYIRKLYFSEGFDFPMAPIERDIAITELLRELATLLMLFAVGYMAGRNLVSRFAWFIYSFAVWDIFYYVFLKVLINWPESLLTDDVLFLIPVIWIGPVITPLILSGLMITLAMILIRFDKKNIPVKISLLEWSLYILGSIVLIIAFTWEYSGYVIQNHSFSKIWVWPTNDVLTEISCYFIPQNFNWVLFFIGVLPILVGIVSIHLRYRKS